MLTSHKAVHCNLLWSFLLLAITLGYPPFLLMVVFFLKGKISLLLCLKHRKEMEIIWAGSVTWWYRLLCGWYPPSFFCLLIMYAGGFCNRIYEFHCVYNLKSVILMLPSFIFESSHACGRIHLVYILSPCYSSSCYIIYISVMTQEKFFECLKQCHFFILLCSWGLSTLAISKQLFWA